MHQYLRRDIEQTFVLTECFVFKKFERVWLFMWTNTGGNIRSSKHVGDDKIILFFAIPWTRLCSRRACEELIAICIVIYIRFCRKRLEDFCNVCIFLSNMKIGKAIYAHQRVGKLALEDVLFLQERQTIHSETSHLDRNGVDNTTRLPFAVWIRLQRTSSLNRRI